MKIRELNTLSNGLKDAGVTYIVLDYFYWALAHPIWRKPFSGAGDMPLPGQ